MNKIYTKFYAQKIFTLDESRKIIKKYQVCKNTLNRLVNKNLIKRIRKTIYQIIPIDNPNFDPDNIHIATNLRKDAIICCNTALYAYKLWKPEDTIYLGSKYASKIRIKENTFKIIKNLHNIGINTFEYNTGYTNIELKITDLERTFLDCLWNRTIKIDELIQILKTGKLEINIKHILKYLEKYKKPVLYNKVGFLLDCTKQNLNLHDEELDQIKKKLTKKTYYIKEKGLTLIRPRYKYYQKWNIMIPENLYEIVTPKTIA